MRPVPAWEVIGPDGTVHYRRPDGDPLLLEGVKRPGYWLRKQSVEEERPMVGALGGVLDGLEWDLGTEAMVEFPGHGIAPGTPGLLGGHETSSVCTSLKPYSAYTASGDNAMNLIRLPRLFLDDHDERMCDNVEGIPLVVRVKETARFVWVEANDPGLADLINDAEHYSDADKMEGWDESAKRLGPAARRVLAVLKPRKVA